MKTNPVVPLAGLALLLNLSAVSAETSTPVNATLKDAFKDDFLMGVAINQAQSSGQDARGDAIIKSQFNSISPENILKWEAVHPEPDKYNFAPADRYVEFGEKNGMTIIGHCLVWHNQTPAWVFQDGKGGLVDRETLLQRMSNHIHTVVSRYKGRIKAWDVVNEAVYPDGSMRATNLWYKIIGEDFIAKAFQFAHEADPKAELTYNDFALEDKPKRDGVIRIIKKLQAKKIPITGIGSQMHARLDWPTLEAVDEHITELASLGLKVMITELDVDVLPEAKQYRGTNLTENAKLNAELNIYPNGLPYAVRAEQAKRYQDFFRIFHKHADKIDRVTFWCVTDADSWLNYWPVTPRVNYPLLFDREGKPKLAFEAVMKIAGVASAKR